MPEHNYIGHAAEVLFPLISIQVCGGVLGGYRGGMSKLGRNIQKCINFPSINKQTNKHIEYAK